jgi:hypothetical protein
VAVGLVVVEQDCSALWVEERAAALKGVRYEPQLLPAGPAEPPADRTLEPL